MRPFFGCCFFCVVDLALCGLAVGVLSFPPCGMARACGVVASGQEEKQRLDLMRKSHRFRVISHHTPTDSLGIPKPDVAITGERSLPWLRRGISEWR